MKASKLTAEARAWKITSSKKMRHTTPHNPWWSFAHSFEENLEERIQTFIQGNHRFTPLRASSTGHHWSHCDRMILHLLYQHIKPTFKHVISNACMHLKGPSIIKTMHQDLLKALSSSQYHYVCRLDARSFYTSIDHFDLCRQLQARFDDAYLLNDLEAIITTPLDRDIIIPLPSKRSFQKAKKKIYKILGDLKLTLASKKSIMGTLDHKTFHYLSINYDRTQTRSTHKTQVYSRIHPRTCQRALTQLTHRTYSSKHLLSLATDQRYLRRSLAWWHCHKWHLPHKSLQTKDHIMAWVGLTKRQCPAHAWLGEGLLLCGKPKSLMRNILIKIGAYLHQQLTPLIDTRLVH